MYLKYKLSIRWYYLTDILKEGNLPMLDNSADKLFHNEQTIKLKYLEQKIFDHRKMHLVT
jgi:hypothetical protein